MTFQPLTVAAVLLLVAAAVTGAVGPAAATGSETEPAVGGSETEPAVASGGVGPLAGLGGDEYDSDGDGNETDDGTNSGDGNKTDDGDGNATDDVTVEGSPDLAVFAPNNVVEPGERVGLTVQISNGGTVDEGGLSTPSRGERLVTTARNVRIEVDDGNAPVQVRTSEQALGDLPSGSIAEAVFEIDVDPDADPGVYRLPVTVRYDRTESVSNDERDDDSETEEFEVRLVVEEDGRFVVEDVDEDLAVGETGPVELTLENVGEADLTGAIVTVRSLNGDLTLNGGSAVTRFVGDWDDGDEVTVEFDATATADAGTRPQRYALEATVEYTDERGDLRESLPLFFGVRLDDEQSFSLDDVSGDLRVGEDGTVTGLVRNDGPDPVANALVRLVDEDGDVVAQLDESVVGDLDVGEDRRFTFPVRVGDDAKPGPRRLTLVVSYLDRQGDPRTSDSLFSVVDVAPERDRFVVRDVDADVQADETGVVFVRLENVGPEDVTDAEVTLRSPNRDLRVGDDDEATRYVGDWDVGDNRTVAVEVSARNRFAGQSYPLTLTVSYTDGDGDRRQSDGITVRVTPDGEQRFAVRDASSTLRIGEEGRVEGTVINRGPRNVSSVVVRLERDDPNLDPRETEFVVGDLADGERARFDLPVAVLDTAQPGDRRLSVVVEYVTGAGDRRETDPISVVVRVRSESDRFSLLSVASDLQAADTGTVFLTLQNRRGETVRNARVTLTAESDATTLATGGDADTRFVGLWPAGATRSVRFRVDADEESGGQTYAFRVEVDYEDEDGQVRASDPLRFGATPAAEQGFDVTTIESTLRVGEEGRVVAALTNRGTRDLSLVGVELVTTGVNVNPVETEAAVGGLAPGESKVFTIPIEISESAVPGERQLGFRVQYTDGDGDRRTSDVVVANVTVAPERDPFVVARADVRVTAGESDSLELSITNNRGVPLRDIRAKAFADDPLSVEDDQAFVPLLLPGESTTIQFTIAGASGATPKVYPLSVDFLYTLPDGDDELSKPVTVGVTVDEPAPQQLPDWLLPLVLLLIVGGIAFLLVRRLRQAGRRRPTAPDAPPAAGASTARGDTDGSGAAGDDD